MQLSNIFFKPKMSLNQECTILSFCKINQIENCNILLWMFMFFFLYILDFWKVLSTNLPLCHKNPRTSQPAWQIGSIRIAVQASEKHYDSGVLYYGRKCLFLSMNYVYNILFFLMACPSILGWFQQFWAILEMDQKVELIKNHP